MADAGTLALQIRIGVFVMIALGAALGLIYLLGSQARYFERKYDIFAEFPEVGGLIEGATVRLAGVQIGRVTDVVLAPEVGGKVRVTLTVARRFSERIRKDSRARIVTQGLLGDRLVEITQGSPGQPPLKPGDAIASDEPFEIRRVFSEGAAALASVRPARGLAPGRGRPARARRGVRRPRRRAEVGPPPGRAARRHGQGRRASDVSAAARSVRRIAEEVETGKGLLHALVYDEPETLRRLNGLLASAQETPRPHARRPERRRCPAAPESARGARSLDRGDGGARPRVARRRRGEEGLLSALLYDPSTRRCAATCRSSPGTSATCPSAWCGARAPRRLLSDGSARAPGRGRQTGADFAAAMANLRVITERLRAGEGTLGGLLEDPTVYENLAAFLDGAQRSFLLRALIGRASAGGAAAESGGDGSRAGPRRRAPRARESLTVPRERGVYRCQTCGFRRPSRGRARTARARAITWLSSRSASAPRAPTGPRSREPAPAAVGEIQVEEGERASTGSPNSIACSGAASSGARWCWSAAIPASASPRSSSRRARPWPSAWGRCSTSRARSRRGRLRCARTGWRGAPALYFLAETDLRAIEAHVVALARGRSWSTRSRPCSCPISSRRRGASARCASAARG